MKNTEKIVITLAACFIIGFTLLAFDNKTRLPETITHISTSLIDAKSFIDKYASQGYTVKFIISQSVSTSILSISDQYGNNKGYKNNTLRDLKGDILLVMEK